MKENVIPMNPYWTRSALHKERKEEREKGNGDIKNKRKNINIKNER